MSPMDRSKYPANWEEVSRLVRWMAGQRCQFCGVRNGSQGFRMQSGAFVLLEPHHLCADYHWGVDWAARCIRIVLTVAHLNHDPMDCRWENLRSLCQRCHLIWDRHHHARNAARTRDRKRGQMRLV